MEVNNPEQAWACQKFYACELLKIVPAHKACVKSISSLATNRKGHESSY